MQLATDESHQLVAQYWAVTLHLTPSATQPAAQHTTAAYSTFADGLSHEWVMTLLWIDYICASAKGYNSQGQQQPYLKAPR
jgi:hypothetical protein